MMTDIEKLIEDLKEIIPTGWVATDQLEKDQNTLSDTISFLSSLQPSANEELVKELQCLPVTRLCFDQDYIEISGTLSRKICSVLSAPQVPQEKAFDVIEHLRSGGVVNNQNDNLYRVVGGSLEIKQSVNDGRWTDKSSCVLFFNDLYFGSFSAYKEPVLEDGFAWFKKPLQNDYMAIFQVKEGKICHANGTSEISDPHHWEFVEKIEEPEQG